MEPTRLFVALWPPPVAVEALAGALGRVRGHVAGGSAAVEVRWQPAERWHVTLAFLGTAPPGRTARRLSAYLDSAASHPERIRLAGAGAFGPVVWVGVEHGPWLDDLARGVQDSLHVADRRFRAHVTVGRTRGADGPGRARAVVPALAGHRGPWWTPGEVTLVASETGPHPQYRVLQRWALEQDPPASG